MAAKLGGSGGDKHTIEQTADINITPFIDILLVLMIIFMVAAPMATVSIRLDLPPADPGRERQQVARLRALAEESGLDPIFAEKFFTFIVAEVIQPHEEIRDDHEAERAKQTET